MCLEWGQESNTHLFPLGPNRLLLAKLNKMVATWSLWEHIVPELTEAKTSSGPTQGLSNRVPSPWLEGSLLLLLYWSLCVETSPESKLTGSEAIAGHRDTGTPGTQLAEISSRPHAILPLPRVRRD